MKNERPCTIADNECTAPANYEGAYTSVTCFGCGQPVCLKCSVKREWYTFGGQRICRSCDEDSQKPTRK